MATVRHRKPENWLSAISHAGHGISEERPLGQREQASEALLMGLRLSEGVDISQLSARFGLSGGELCDQTKADFLETQGLVWRQGSRLGVTDQGIGVLDALLGELVPAGLLAA